jgi:hypothetical protein
MMKKLQTASKKMLTDIFNFCWQRLEFLEYFISMVFLNAPFWKFSDDAKNKGKQYSLSFFFAKAPSFLLSCCCEPRQLWALRMYAVPLITCAHHTAYLSGALNKKYGKITITNIDWIIYPLWKFNNRLASKQNVAEKSSPIWLGIIFQCFKMEFL